VAQKPGNDRAVFDGGSREGVAEIYDRHARAVFAHCLRRTADWMGAEDLTSAVFTEVVRRPQRVRFHEGSALPWLLVTATNLRRNAGRSMFRELRRRSWAVHVEPDFAPEADVRMDELSRVRVARGLFDRLPHSEQQVFALCEWSDLTYDEAAFALRIPVGTVRSRLSRARRRLEQMIEEDAPPWSVLVTEGALRDD
jgi:RNA polymerase sigma factor (sigma-70 family)